MPAPRMYKTEAIVLRQRRFGEADRFLTVYTPAHGKMDVKARGVRKTTSRMSGHLQPLTRCMLQLAQGHLSDVVAGCETLESFQPLREDLDRLSHALYAAELIDRFVPERTHSFPTYRLLLETLRRLAGTDDLGQTLRFFEMRLVDQCGFRPELESCSGCGSQVEHPQEEVMTYCPNISCPSRIAAPWTSVGSATSGGGRSSAPSLSPTWPTCTS